MYKTARQKDAANIEKLEVDLKERDKTIARLQAETQTLAVRDKLAIRCRYSLSALG